MKQNIKIAKELVKLAKSLIAKQNVADHEGKYENFTGTIDYDMRAEVENATFELKNNEIIWKSGTWLNGDFDGTWENGEWLNGIFHGTWEDGTWHGGSFNGTWKKGKWHGGIFYNGTWENGTWYDGEWNQKSSKWLIGRWIKGELYNKENHNYNFPEKDSKITISPNNWNQ